MVAGTKGSFGNRLRFGGELHLGQDYRYLVGLTLGDYISSAESDPWVGDLHRSGSDIELGYFLIPSRLWIKYSFYLGGVSASQVAGAIFNDGQGLSVGLRVVQGSSANLAIELGYLYLFSASTPAFNFGSQTITQVVFPHASIVSLGLRLGFDINGSSD